MSELFDSMNDRHMEFIRAQHMFFVASAPTTTEGHVNTSPKGLDCFRILGDRTVAYLDVTGSGNETSAHLRDNGRITFMFCAFDGAPKNLRLYGRGRTILPATDEWNELIPNFSAYPGARQIIIAGIHQVQTSCGFAVPLYDFVADRDTLTKWAVHHGPDGLEQYRATRNVRSIDGLPTEIGTRHQTIEPAASVNR